MDEMTTAMVAQIRDIEQRDESQILAELAGDQVKEFVYAVEAWEKGLDGRKHKTTKYKLSWAGTREVARSRGNIILVDPIVTETEHDIRVVVKGTDMTRNFSIFGGTHQPKKMKINEYDPGSGEIIGSHLEDDSFCFQKALSKAQRNALQSIIPADYVAKMIARLLQASGRAVQANPKAKKAAPPTDTKQEGKAPQAEKPTPAKQQIKSREEWDKITKEQVPDYAKLEPIIWNLAKLQPAELYKALGFNSRQECTITAWEAFNTIKEVYQPKEPKAAEPKG